MGSIPSITVCSPLLKLNNRNWTRYPVSERDFRASYASLRENGVKLDPDDVRFLPLLFVVLAIAVRLAPDRIGGNAKTRRLTSGRYYWCCESYSAKVCRLLNHSPSPAGSTNRRRNTTRIVGCRPHSASGDPTSSSTISGGLRYPKSARFLTFDRRITECWSQLGAAVRTAQALGLHRDGADMVRQLK